jgi:hypothetical protein
MISNQIERKRLKLVWLAMAIILVLSGLLAAFVATPAKADTALVINTPTVTYGGTINLSGTGFVSNERVAIWVTAPNGVAYDYGFVPAGIDGTFTNFTPPFYIESGAPGVYTVSVKGLTGTDSVKTAQFTLLSPTLSTSVSKDGTTSTITFSGSRWFNYSGEGEKVSLWVTDRAGAVSLSYEWTSPDGVLSGSFSGMDIPPGRYSLTAYGQTSGATVVSEFNISR